jgi:hypothetical protein
VWDDGVSLVPQLTYKSPSCSIAMSQPWTSLPSDSLIRCRSSPESVERLI